MPEQVWGERSLEKETRWKNDHFELTIKRADQELWISSSLSSRVSPKDPQWFRWALNEDVESLNIAPRFPNKALVVKPDHSFRLLPGVDTKIYVSVPASLAIRLSSNDLKPLTEIATEELSLTWFGSPLAGELCYWISSRAQRKRSKSPKYEHSIICPVLLKNRSSDELLVEKLCLRTKWLSIFESGPELWASETQISYRGGEDVSQITVSENAPDEAQDARLIVASQEILRRNFSIRTFFALGGDEPVRGVEPD